MVLGPTGRACGRWGRSRCAESPPATLPLWRRLLRRLLRLRQLQRYLGYLGLYLQDYPRSLRDRLRAVYPTEKEKERREKYGAVYGQEAAHPQG